MSLERARGIISGNPLKTRMATTVSQPTLVFSEDEEEKKKENESKRRIALQAAKNFLTGKTTIFGALSAVRNYDNEQLSSSLIGEETVAPKLTDVFKLGPSVSKFARERAIKDTLQTLKSPTFKDNEDAVRMILDLEPGGMSQEPDVTRETFSGLKKMFQTVTPMTPAPAAPITGREAAAVVTSPIRIIPAELARFAIGFGLESTESDLSFSPGSFNQQLFLGKQDFRRISRSDDLYGETFKLVNDLTGKAGFSEDASRNTAMAGVMLMGLALENPFMSLGGRVSKEALETSMKKLLTQEVGEDVVSSLDSVIKTQSERILQLPVDQRHQAASEFILDIKAGKAQDLALVDQVFKDSLPQKAKPLVPRAPESIEEPGAIRSLQTPRGVKARRGLEVGEEGKPYDSVYSEVDDIVKEPIKPLVPGAGDLDDAKAFGRFRESMGRWWVNTREFFDDDFKRVRDLVKDANNKVTEASNPYDAEILFHGRVGARIENVSKEIKNLDIDILNSAKKLDVLDTDLRRMLDEFLVVRHAPERNAALGDGAAGIKTATAEARMNKILASPQADEVVRLAQTLERLNTQTLDILLEGEVISKELYQQLRKKYKHHVPLNRILDDTVDIGGAISGRTLDVKGTGIKRAKGSKREIADVTANIATNVEQAIIRAEKNRVDLATLQFARDNKHLDLFTEVKPKAIGKRFDDSIILQEIRDPQVLHLREKGKPVFLRIEDPKLAMVLRGISRQKLDGVMRMISAITRMWAGLHTRFNPEFAFSNKVRDLQEAVTYAMSKGGFGVGSAAKIPLRDPASMKSVVDWVRGLDTEGAKLYEQMRLDGGTTGGMSLSTRKAVEMNIDKLRRLNRSNPRKAAQKAIEVIDNWNTVFEDSTRLSVYKTALEQGASRKRAAGLAKEASVNFNKMGKGGPVINALYIFSNASIQGSVKMLRAMKNPKVAGTVLTGMMGSVMAVNEWNDRVDPNWRNHVKKWDRMNGLNVVIPSKDSPSGFTYFTIPISWGLKPIKVAADSAYDAISGEEQDIKDVMGSILSSVIEGYNPIGGTDLMSAVTPSILDVPLDVSRNQTWYGGMIKPDWDKDLPDSMRYFDSLEDKATGRASIAVANGLSGLGIEMSPANINYAFEQYIGGVGRAASKFLNAIDKIAEGEDVPLAEAPFTSRFFREVSGEQMSAEDPFAKRVQELATEQSVERAQLKRDAENAWVQLKNTDSLERDAAWNQLVQTDPDLARKIKEVAAQEKLGLTYLDRDILSLGVTNGKRATAIFEQMSRIEGVEKKKEYWAELVEKKIITKAVAEQLRELLAE